jgi:hypothetical protein
MNQHMFIMITALRENRNNICFAICKQEILLRPCRGQVPLDKLTLDIFPGVPSSSAQSIDVPDYLGAGMALHLTDFSNRAAYRTI